LQRTMTAQPTHISSTINKMTRSSTTTKSWPLTENAFIRNNIDVDKPIHISDVTTPDLLNDLFQVSGMSPSDFPSDVPSHSNENFSPSISMASSSIIDSKPAANNLILLISPPTENDNEKELSTHFPVIDTQPLAEPPTKRLPSRPIREPIKILLKDISQLLRPRVDQSSAPANPPDESETKLAPSLSPHPSGSYRDSSSPEFVVRETKVPSYRSMAKKTSSPSIYIPSLALDTPFKSTHRPSSIAQIPLRVKGNDYKSTYIPSVTLTPTPTTTTTTFPTTSPIFSDNPSTAPLVSTIPSQTSTVNTTLFSSNSSTTVSTDEWQKTNDNSSSTAKRYIMATPFVLTYFIDTGSTPTEMNMKQAVDVTTMYAQDILVREFFTQSNILISKFEYITANTDMQRDFPTITYFFNITVAERSQYVPEKIYVDAIIQASFEIPAMVNQLVASLQSIPKTNPFSTTVKVEFLQDPQALKKTTMAHQDQNLTQPLVISIVAVTTVLIMLLIVWAYLRCCSSASTNKKDVSRMPGYATHYRSMNDSNSRDDFSANRVELMKELNIPSSAMYSWDEIPYNQDDPLLHVSESDRLQNNDNTSQSRTVKRQTMKKVPKNNKKNGGVLGFNRKKQSTTQANASNNNNHPYVTDLTRDMLTNTSDYQKYDFDNSNDDIHVVVEDEEEIVRTFLLKHRKGSTSSSGTSSNPDERIPGYSFVDDDNSDIMPSTSRSSQARQQQQQQQQQHRSRNDNNDSGRSKRTMETSSVSSSSIRSRISFV
jgi:hypothetical protein